jgi:hypothetical protein
MIRIEAVWLATAPPDTCCGTDTALARVVKVFDEARRHHAYLFANARANRMKVLVHDGLGLWLCAPPASRPLRLADRRRRARSVDRRATRRPGGRIALATPGRRGRHPRRVDPRLGRAPGNSWMCRWSGPTARGTLAAMLDASQIAPEELASLGESELRTLAAKLLARIEQDTHEIQWRDAKLEKLAYEIAHLRRIKFSARSEHLNASQRALFEESVDADIAALEAELEDLKAPPSEGDKQKAKPRRAELPKDLPHVQISHEPTCSRSPASNHCGASCANRSTRSRRPASSG